MFLSIKVGPDGRVYFNGGRYGMAPVDLRASTLNRVEDRWAAFCKANGMQPLPLPKRVVEAKLGQGEQQQRKAA